MKNFLIIGLLCLSASTYASESDAEKQAYIEKQVKWIKKDIALREKQQKILRSTFAVCTIPIISYFCANKYNSKNGKPTPLFMRCIRNKAIPRASAAVGATSLLALLVVSCDKKRLEHEALNVHYETEAPSQPVYSYYPSQDEDENPYAGW